MIEVLLEVGPKRRVFATAADWPGWSRSGKGEEEALAALAGYAPRYAPVAARAGVRFRAGSTPRTGAELRVVERLTGDGSTEFGIPGTVAQWDRQPLTARQSARRAALVEAAWASFDEVVAGAPAQLRKGPRGGGRDRDPIVTHVREAEQAYARQLGIKLPVPTDPAGAAALREALLAVLRQPSDGTPPVPGRWPVRYAMARIAWHVLDHAWEIEDKS